MKLEDYLIDTDPKHSDMVDAFAYSVAAQTFKLRDDYVFMYIRKKPWFLPERIWKWLISKLLVMALFK